MTKEQLSAALERYRAELERALDLEATLPPGVLDRMFRDVDRLHDRLIGIAQIEVAAALLRASTEPLDKKLGKLHPPLSA